MEFDIGEKILFRSEEAIIIGYNKLDSQCLLDIKFHSKNGYSGEGSNTQATGKCINKVGEVVDVSKYEQIWWAFYSEISKITIEKKVIEKQCPTEKLILRKLIKMQKNYE